MKSQKEAEEQVRSWGFSTVYTWTDRPNSHYKPHSHPGLTTHLILSGQLHISYPEEQKGVTTTYKEGERIDVEAGRVHEVWIGSEGCTYVIGE
ncbi:hypothetical protein QBC38DRAFT_413381 [Podospora fimiseda]|uniref:Uncharacterized protein n=1 Tax=Podospora fimiseda TaxID=252190 RepID=A0AAN7GXD6_9PEZI|nr:hypothetical protein QBC38DRAFT_413381 [Podospora fimiseda]